MPHITVGEAAARIRKLTGADLKPSYITSCFYQRKLREDLCPVIAGRRCIPESYLDQIIALARREGKLEGRTHVGN